MNNEGFFSKLLKGIVSPAARLSVAQQKFSNKLFGGSGQVEDKMARNILGDQKYQAVQQNPFTEGFLKPLASGASYGVQAAIAPIKGAGVLANAGRLAKGGAISGGLAGLGESAQGNEINSIGAGAGTGAVLNLLTGGLLKKQNLKASNAVDKLDNISVKSIFKGTSPEQLKINKLNPNQFQTVAKEVVSRAKSISGKSTIDATDLYNIKNDVVNDAASEINKYSDKVIPDFKVKLGKAFAQNFEKNINTYDKLLKDDTFREAIDGFKAMSSKTTVGDARALWQKLLEARGGFEQSVKSAGKGTNETRLLEKLATIARDSIKTASPEVSQAMKKFSTVNELLDVFTKNYSKTQTAGSVLNKGVLDEAFQDIVNIPSVKAKGAQSIANLLRGRGEGEAQRSALNVVAPSIVGGAIAGVGQNNLSTEMDSTQGGSEAQLPYALNLPSQQNGLYSALLQATQLLPNGSVSQQYGLAQDIMEQNKSELQKQYGGGINTQKLTEKQAMFNSAGQMADKALQLLESGTAQTGKLASAGSSIGRFLGTQSDTQTAYYSALDAARGSAISALSGANVPPSEYERIRGLIPEPTDERNIATQKLRSFKEAMSIYSSGNRNVGIVTQ